MTEHFQRHLDEIEYIVEACKRQGCVLTQDEAYSVWINYSDMYAAGWLGVPKCDKEIIACVKAGQNWES